LALTRNLFVKRSPLVLRTQRPILSRVNRSRLDFGLVRTVASTVSHKPASQNASHALTNAQEEAANTAVDVAKTIAGGHLSLEGQSFAQVTSAVAAQVPKPVMILGLAGAMPYLGTSLTTIYLAKEAGLAAAGKIVGLDANVAISVLNNCLDIQVTYGAVLLSFLGALHWGFEFAGYGGQKGYSRLLLGITPALIAWPTLALSPMTALSVQWLGFTSLWLADMRATSAGWTPKWYSQYRFYLSVLVGTCIIGTLAGTSALGPVAGHSETTHTLERIRADRAHQHTENQGEIDGEIEAISTGEMGDSYVKIQKLGGSDEEAAAEDEEGSTASDSEEEEGGAKEDEQSDARSEKSKEGEE